MYAIPEISTTAITIRTAGSSPVGFTTMSKTTSVSTT
jgi:hypothetical protein